MENFKEIYIIDGYNLLLRAFRHLEGEDLRAARERLEVRLREFLRTVGAGVRLILVYDGARDVAAPHAVRRNDPGLEVVFSAPPRTADDAIIEECRRLEGTAPLTVVTSDLKDIASAVRGLRLRHQTSEDFADVLDEAMSLPWAGRTGSTGTTAGSGPAGQEVSPPAPSGEKPTPEEVSPAEVEEWVKIFSQPKGPRRKPPGGGSGGAR